MDKRTKIIFNASILLLVALAAYRAVVMDFTNDEAYSYFLIQEYHPNLMLGTANTHWLNSICMFLEKFLGHNAWMYRLHSIIGLGIYAYCIIKCFYQYTNHVLLTLLALAVMCNHYLFDFFSLARGYALASAFTVLAFYYLQQATATKPNTFKIYAALALATFANYTCIYLLYSYMLVDIIKQIKMESFKALFTLQFFKSRWPFIAISAIAIPNIYIVKYIGKDLEEGQSNGFIPDTMGVFFQRLLPNLNITAINFLCMFIIISLLIYVTIKKVDKTIYAITSMLSIAIFTIYILYFIAKVPFPFGRTSFFIMVPILFVFVYIIIHLLKSLPKIYGSVIAIVFIASIAGYTYIQRSRYTTIEWYKQQGVNQVVKDLYALHKNNVTSLKLGMSIDHFGSYINFYHYQDTNNAIKHSTKNCFVYGREEYKDFPKGMDSNYLAQDYLLMYGNYHAYLDTILSPAKQILVKRYPLMETDLIRVGR
jgi:hypothetical protein